MSPGPASPLSDAAASQAVIVCAGPGGVGKTSIAATLALQAAHLGRRAAVLTIDPARRLADALGLDELSNDVHRIDGPWPGELHASVLDAGATFDELVRRHAGSAAQAEAILANRFYRNISHALSGTQEYMAAEKLYQLHAEGRYDLIVVDTPPTRQALDFLDAPGQLARFLDHRVYRLMTSGRRGVGGVINRAGFAVLRTASRLVGASVMQDAMAFFSGFEGMESGFRRRSEEVRELLVSPRTSFVVVTTPHRDTVLEARFFVERLAAERLPVTAVVANLATPRFVTDAGMRTGIAVNTSVDAASLVELADRHRGTPFGTLVENLAELDGLVAQEDEVLAPLGIDAATDGAPATRAPLLRVPRLGVDVHDLPGLELLRERLFREPDERGERDGPPQGRPGA